MSTDPKIPKKVPSKTPHPGVNVEVAKVQAEVATVESEVSGLLHEAQRHTHAAPVEPAATTPPVASGGDNENRPTPQASR